MPLHSAAALFLAFGALALSAWMLTKPCRPHRMGWNYRCQKCGISYFDIVSRHPRRDKVRHLQALHEGQETDTEVT